MNEIYTHAAQALSNMEVPGFDDFDEEEVFEAFAYTPLIMGYKEWFSEFQQLIKDMSNGQTKLIEQPFYTGIRGLNKTYLLTKGDVTKRVIIAQGIPPIEIHENK